MPLDFNVAEIATRLRRSLGVRGRMPLTLDETQVGVIIGADATRSPFRTTSKVYRIWNSVAPTAGNFAAIELVNGAGGPLVIEQLFLVNRSAAIAAVVIAGFSTPLIAAPQAVFAPITGEVGVGGETNLFGITAPFERNRSALSNSYDLAASSTGALIQQDFNFTIAALDQIILPVDITLYPSQSAPGLFQLGYLVACNTASAQLAVGMQVRMLP